MSDAQLAARIDEARALHRRGDLAGALRLLGEATREGDLAEGTLPASLNALLAEAGATIKPLPIARKPDDGTPSESRPLSKAPL